MVFSVLSHLINHHLNISHEIINISINEMKKFILLLKKSYFWKSNNSLFKFSFKIFFFLRVWVCIYLEKRFTFQPVVRYTIISFWEYNKKNKKCTSAREGFVLKIKKKKNSFMLVSSLVFGVIKIMMLENK